MGVTSLKVVNEMEKVKSFTHLLDIGNALLQKNIYFCFTDYTNTFNCVDHNKLENSSRDGNTRPPYLPPQKSVCRSRSSS